MKKYIALAAVLFGTALTSMAQKPVEGTAYYLPKTEMRFQLLIEKTTFTPGEYAIYSERFLKKKQSNQSSTEYKIVGVSMYTSAIPDTSKTFTVLLDKKHTIFNVERDHNGVLLAINAKGKTIGSPAKFTPAPKPKTINPRDFMSEDILTAGNTAKMAELTAREIYDIRDSRNQLSRGEADYMPKDGEQLKLMLEGLNKQEKALLQMFEGTTVCDTLQKEITFCPEKGMSHELLFRFSQLLGIVDNDDMGGAPYYIDIEDLNTVPALDVPAEPEKKTKVEPGITVNMPGKIKATLLNGAKPMSSFELYAAQFGNLENLSYNLFTKKATAHIVLDPVNGNVLTLDVEPLE